MTANDYELFRQFFRISIEHRTPSATLGTGHPDFSEQGIYLYDTSPMTDEDVDHLVHPNTTSAFFAIHIELLESFRIHVVRKFGFTSIYFHDRGTKLLSDLVIKKDYPPN
ncbi:hypothetical protein GN958_ATG13528 [Phytophthora infestans]|uniref:Uncharacterized protein n=1 Tax=Phytophthora infestans TaxID=4787 RepID=A0A8S9U861_PHYIN|nr:hypothetical protein GN958_ATG13528 [Phytophthora infestans]